MYRSSRLSLTTAATALLLLTGTDDAEALSDTEGSAGVLEAVVPQVAAESTAVSTTSDPDSALQTDVAGIHEQTRLCELERENRELRRANATLKSASAFFAERDRPSPR